MPKSKANEESVNSVDKIKREINKKRKKAIEIHHSDDVMVEKESTTNTSSTLKVEEGTADICKTENQERENSDYKTKVVVFKLNDDEYAIELFSIKEIIRVPQITRVPNLSMYITGVCNLKGELVNIIDIHKRFNIQQKMHSEMNRVIVMDYNGCSIGIIVDEVLQVLTVDKSSVKLQLGSNKSNKEGCIDGIIMEENGKRLIMMMNMQGIINIDDIETTFTNADKQAGQEVLTFTKEKEDKQQLIIFSIDEVEYAFDISKVKEIIRIPSITKTPNSSGFNEGIILLRNEVIQVINLSKILKVSNSGINKDGSILIIDEGNLAYGVIVDKVLEVKQVSKIVLRRPPEILGDIDVKMVKEFANLDNGKRVVIVLDPYKLIDIEEFGREYQNNHKEEGSDRSTKSALQTEDTRENIVIFKIKNEEYGVSINFVQEINRISKITRLPNVPSFIEGLINLRGDMIPLLNLRRFLGLDNEDRETYSKILVVKLNKTMIGLDIDSASEVLSLSKELFEDYPQVLNSKDNMTYIDGMIKLNEGRRIVLLLNLKGILDFL
jgi:purine-binding chemotaxis protein CheW